MNSRIRCPWAGMSKPGYVEYHDEEWGVPIHDDHRWFEFLTLESAQAGLSWYTVLRKRENYRRAFAGFDPAKVAQFSAAHIETLLQDPGIIRNRRKVEAAVNNAARFLEIQSEFGSFDDYIWRFTDGEPIINHIETLADYPTTSEEAIALSKDLKARGFKFLGPTVIYAHMQASGMINDHLVECFRRDEIISMHGGRQR